MPMNIMKTTLETLQKAFPQQLIHLFTRERRLVIVIPYIWLALFFLIPFLIVLKISFSESQLALPPFRALLEWTQNQSALIHLNFSGYWTLFTDSFYVSALISSMGIAFIATITCLIVGYMTAYALTQVSRTWRPICLLLVILPFWTSFLVRVYAWIGLLSNEGVINQFLKTIGIISEPLSLLHNTGAVIIGIVYCYLPFMILPIYSILDKIDKVYLEAAADLGCTPWKAFWKITVPLSKPGIMAGCILVFIPAIGEFVIPELLGAPETLMIGRVLWTEFFSNRDWPLACALAVVMLVLFVIPIMLFQKWQLKEQEARK